jgi:hypothetical protein
MFLRLLELGLLVFLVTTVFEIASAQKEKTREKKSQQEGRLNILNRRNTEVDVENGNIVFGTPTGNSITANIILTKGSEAFIEYGTIRGSYKNKTQIFKWQNDGPFEINISKLAPNIRYFYRLNYKVESQAAFIQLPEGWFTTQRNPAASFSFGVQGDSHPEREGKMFSPLLYQQTLTNVSDRKPDFYFMMGDDFSIDRLIENNQVNKEKIERVYQLQRYYLGNAGKNPPLFLVNGNHEQAAKYLLDGTANNAAVLAANARNKYFPLPAPGQFYTGDKETVTNIGTLKDYYAFEWGNALFVVIDPYWHSNIPVDNIPGSRDKKERKDPWGITLGAEQYQWLKKTLESSKTKYKFVFSHHVSGRGRGGVERAKYFEWGGFAQNGDWQFDKYRPGWEIPIHQLMVKNKVTIFFQGHDHLFARQELDGIIYQTVPNPADDTYTAFNKDAYTSGTILPNSGYLYVTVSKGDVKVDYIRSYLSTDTSLSEAAKQPYSYTIR